MTESLLRLMRDARRARRGGPAAIAQRQRERLADMVAFARAHSPYYRSLYQDLPDQVSDPRLLPTTSKKPLMADFDDGPCLCGRPGRCGCGRVRRAVRCR